MEISFFPNPRDAVMGEEKKKKVEEIFGKEPAQRTKQASEQYGDYGDESDETGDELQRSVRRKQFTLLSSFRGRGTKRTQERETYHGNG